MQPLAGGITEDACINESHDLRSAAARREDRAKQRAELTLVKRGPRLWREHLSKTPAFGAQFGDDSRQLVLGDFLERLVHEFERARRIYDLAYCFAVIRCWSCRGTRKGMEVPQTSCTVVGCRSQHRYSP